MRSYEDLKKSCSIFFKRIRNLISVNLEGALNYLENTFVKVLQGNDINSIANVFFLVSEMCENQLFERNILYETQNEGNFPHFGKILCICLEWINKYRTQNNTAEIIEIGVLFFMEKITHESLNNFSYEN